ncbi:MAG: Uma2 family endonuclease [Chloroflexota bacterium]|nr:MAG: Uma2 family endonuclease [Chloroflexota bacterium]
MVQARDIAAPPEIERWRWTVNHFRKLGESGALPADARVELIGGEIVMATAPGRRHLTRLDTLIDQFRRPEALHTLAWRDGWLRLSANDEARVDLIVLPKPAREPAPEPRSRDVLLLVEVADASRAYDLQFKADLYGRAGVPEYWVLDLVDRWVVSFREPGPKGYRLRQVTLPGASLAPRALPELSIAVATLVS